MVEPSGSLSVEDGVARQRELGRRGAAAGLRKPRNAAQHSATTTGTAAISRIGRAPRDAAIKMPPKAGATMEPTRPTAAFQPIPVARVPDG